jgi:HPt (histidine-containing phosphotransfer) domain-containing protein
MNGHIIKPVVPDSIYAELGGWLPEYEAAPLKARTQSQRFPNDDNETGHVDVNTGLQFFDGDWEAYQRLAEKFIDLHGADADKLSCSLEAGDRTEAVRVVHTLKGVAATLGATKLSEIASDLLISLRDGADLSELRQALNVLREELILVVREIRGRSEVKSPQKNTIRIDEAVQRLIGRLEHDDIRSLEAWRELKPLLAETRGTEVMATLERHIREFDFPAALADLRKLAAQD